MNHAYLLGRENSSVAVQITRSGEFSCLAGCRNRQSHLVCKFRYIPALRSACHRANDDGCPNCNNRTIGTFLPLATVALSPVRQIERHQRSDFKMHFISCLSVSSIPKWVFLLHPKEQFPRKSRMSDIERKDRTPGRWVFAPG